MGRVSGLAKRPTTMGRALDRTRRTLERPPLSLLYTPTRRFAKSWLRGRMRAHDVVRVVEALRAAGVPFCIAGGWAVDALVGRPTRPHDDLDVAVEDYWRDEPLVRRALAPLGLEVTEQEPAGLWMPLRTLLDDRRGHRVEVVSLNWQLIRTAADTAPVADVGCLDSISALGTVAGRRVPCLNRDVQLLFRTGFDQRGVDDHDRRVLADSRRRSWLPPARRAPRALHPAVRTPQARTAALVLTVPEADRAVGDLRRRLDPAAGQGLPAHITLMFPFPAPETLTPAGLELVAALARRCETFDFTLDGVGWFDRRVLYVAPEPAAPFVRLVEDVQQAFPGCRPYGGAFDSVVPHLTVAEDAAAVDLVSADTEVRRRLPIRCRAVEISLFVDDGGWHEHCSFPLGRQRHTG